MNRSFSYLSLPIVLLISSSCSVWKARNPASERDVYLSEIYNEIGVGLDLVGKDSLRCYEKFNSIYKKLFNTAALSSYFDSSDQKALDLEIQSAFETRLLMMENFKNFKLNNSFDRDCLNSSQDVLRALRYVEDYLVEMRMDHDPSSAADYTTLKGEFPYFLVNPKYNSIFKSYEDLKSGDVILSRGNAYTSAAIARIAEGDYQFSHLSFVYRHPRTNEMFTTEAHIEIGSVTAPFSSHIDEKNVRTVVFRYKDPEVAHKASELIFNRVKKQQQTGKNIEYDFSMNFKDESRLFCSEVISAGFKMASPDADYVPMFKSKFTKGMIPFLNTIGIPVTNETISTTEVFAPGDVQLDPNFELVAEWRNPKRLEESRIKDFILTKLFEKMDKSNYRFDGSLKMDIQSKTYWLLRRTPLVKKFVENKFPLNMSPAQLEIFMVLDKVGDAIYKNLELKALDFDRSMTPKEIYAAIDDFVASDFETYQRYRKGIDNTRPAFHLLFHP